MTRKEEIIESFFSWWEINISNFSAALIDIDGTLLLGDIPIPGAKEYISFLKKKKFPLYAGR